MLRRADATDGRSTRPAIVAVSLLGLVVAVAMLVATASGLGVSPDGVAYLSLADELRTGGSPYATLAPSPTHYAPFWAIVVGAVAGVTGIDDLLGIGRILNALLAASIPVLVYASVRRAAAAPVWWGVLAAAVVAFLFGLFRLSVRALTEPLFVVLLLAALLLVEIGADRRSRRILLAAAAVAAMAVMTRFAGAVLVVPLAVAAWRAAPSGLRRVVDTATVTAIALVPTAVWALAAPDTTTSTHLDAESRGGLTQIIDSIVEAGYVIVAPPSTGFADPLYLLLGALTLAAPIAATAMLVARRGVAGPGGSRFAALEATGLSPWVLFLATYTALIAVQRWWIDREIIDRYWVPYVVVGVVIVARAVAELGVLENARWRRVAGGTAAILVVVNLGLVASFVVARTDRGIELNEVRYQDTMLFDAVAAAGADQVLTDSTRLVELHLVVLGDTDVTVRDIGCSWAGDSNVTALVDASDGSTAVVLAGACDREETRAALASIDGSDVVVDERVGTVVLIPAR
jgi:4-amino-4-deoxy-L-arabinose transferase-like glycosyltransferase